MSEPSPPVPVRPDAAPGIRAAAPARPMLPRSPPAPPLLEAFGALVDWTVVLIGAAMIVSSRRRVLNGAMPRPRSRYVTRPR